MPLVEVRVLGPLEVDVAGRRLELRRQKERGVLALLALRPGEVFSQDRLVDELWGARPPKSAIGSLQNLVSGLRRALPPEVLVTRPPGYALDLAPELVDAPRFELQVEEARRRADPGDRARLLRAALGLWRGTPLADVELGTFAAAEASRLEELRTAAREEQFEAELEVGAHAQLIGDLEQLVTDHPLRERPTALLMLALYRAGRQVEALQVYQRAREQLVEELGIDPWPELRRLESAILRQDPTLAPPTIAAQTTGAPVASQERRKTVTILFADLVNSTELGAGLDPEVLRAVLRRYFDAAQRVVERHGGTVEKFIGDAVMAVFGIPTVHEDDALRAVRAARELREAIARVNTEHASSGAPFLEVRIGINTGEVLAADPAAREAYATGKTVNVAVRLEEAALPGEILLGESTHNLVSYAVESGLVENVDLGGALGVVHAYRLLEVGDAPRPLGHASLVGRANELARLSAALAGVRAERRSRVIAVVGDAGVGKTRLASELIATLTSTERALIGRCTPYGDGATYLPLAEVVAQAVPSRRADAIAALLAGDEHASLIAQRVAQLTGETQGSASAGEIFWAVRRFLERVAADGTTIVVLDDVHWAEPTLLDLVEYLASWPAEAPLLVICLARRELLDERPGWRQPSRVIALEPLEPDDARELLDELAPTDLRRRDRDRIAEVAEGNPLFLEQLLAYAGEVGADHVSRAPPSIEAILAARLERLEPEERALLERASVAGRECRWSALVHLTPPAELAGAELRVMDLVRRGFLVGSRTDGGDSLRFQHGLVRDVAYGGMTKEARVGVHERYAEWLERAGGGPAEVVAYHLEQAFDYRRNLGLVDAHAVQKARHASGLLASAGRQAPARGDWPAAAALLSRAAALLPDDDRDRLQLLPELGRALGRCGDYAREIELLDDAIARARAAGDRSTEIYARLFRGHARMHVDPAFSVDDELPAVHEALQTFGELGDAHGEARAWGRLAYYEWFRGHNVDARAAAEHTLAYAVSAGNHALEAETRGFIGSTLFNGPAPLNDLIAYARDLEEPGRRGRESRMRPLLGLVGIAHAMQGDFEQARSLVAEEVAAYEDVGNVHAALRAAADGFGAIALLTGEPAAAVELWSRELRALEEVGETGHLSSVAAFLANALCVAGRYADAREHAQMSERAAGLDDYLSQVLWRTASARVLADEGRLDDGVDMAREAVRLARATDDLNTTGDALMSLAHVLRLGGGAEASQASGEAERLYERKGNLVMAGAARALVEGKAPSPAL